MRGQKLLLLSTIVLLVAGCAAPRPIQSQGAPSVAATATRVRVRPSPTAQAVAAATATALLTSTPTATATALPTSPEATPTAMAPAQPSLGAPSPSTAAALTTGGSAAPSPAATLVVTGSAVAYVPSLYPDKYAAPVLVTPDNNAVYHVAQPVVHFVWTNTPDTLMTFGELPQCTSDDTYFRHVLETNQILIHYLDDTRPDIVGWMDTGTDYNLNLTTVPPGRYSWSVSVVAVCESYELKNRVSTMTRGLLGPVSPSSAPRAFTWTP